MARTGNRSHKRLQQDAVKIKRAERAAPVKAETETIERAAGLKAIKKCSPG